MFTGIHAREWISPATLTFILRDLVTNTQHEHLLDMFDFFILPVVNPDGWVRLYLIKITTILLFTRYEFSHTTDRLWRKNRAFNPEVFGLCRGVDLNRNFGYKWANKVQIINNIFMIFYSTILVEHSWSQACLTHPLSGQLSWTFCIFWAREQSCQEICDEQKT